jgi:methyl-accepting chemotaxis protein
MMKDVSISVKLYLLVGLSMLALGAFGLTAYSTVRTVMVDGPAYNRIMEGKDLIADVLPPPVYITEARQTLMELLSAQDSGAREALLKRMAGLSHQFQERSGYWREHLADGELKDALATSGDPASAFFAAFSKRVEPLIRQGKLDEARAASTEELLPLYVTHRAAIDRVVELANAAHKASESDAHSVVAGRMIWMVAVGVSCAVVMLIAATVLNLSMTRPLGQLLAVVRDVAQGDGDLTKRVNLARKDEIGRLSGYIDTVLTQVHDLVRDVADTSRAVVTDAAQIAASAEELAQGMRLQHGQTQQVSAAVEEMSASVEVVARRSAEATTASAQSQKQAEDGGQLVTGTVSEMERISQEVRESAQAVGSLGRRGEQIGQIIGVIKDIADQTNLLALNAAIEAARAGAHGRGFAVVADEVRKLAERTTGATEQVGQSIREIQRETGGAVERIESGTQRVAQGVQLAGRAGGALAQIVADSATVQQMVRSIAASANEQSAASAEISRSVAQINAVTRESTEAASQAATAAAQLNVRATRLERLVSRFKIERRTDDKGAPAGSPERRTSLVAA